MANTLAMRMAEYSVALRYEDLSTAVVHEVKRRLLDSIGCALGAWDADPSVIGRKIAATLSADRGATIIGTRHKSPPDWAAFVNGCMVRYLDYNDTYLSKEPAHPSDNIPAALAVAEASGASGRELITAVVIAYEIQCRLCDAASLRAIGWDHVTYGAFSTALAASRLMRLDIERTRHAVNIAGVRSAALRQSRVGELSHWKGCAFADAARQGVFAAMLAREGMTGPSPIFEGEKGFEKLVSGPLVLAGPFADVANQSGSDCMICSTSIKCWPVEYHAQSAVDAALQLRRLIPAVDQIASILVESHDAAVDIIGSEPEKWSPTTRETADHSLPYIVAAALADGEMTDRQFAPQRLRDPHLLALVQKVKVVRNRELSSAYPGAVGNIVTVTLTNDQSFTRRVDHACGHARNPMSDELLEQKFHSLADPRLGPSRAAQVIAWIRKLDQTTNVGGLFPLIEVTG
jgi:2-methylcitrate dehydratase